MKIIATFAIVEDSLFAVQYENTNVDEFTNLFRLWNDAEYLTLFFEKNKSDLEGFWRGISIEKAVMQTQKYAKELQKKLIQIAKQGKTDRYETLSTLFKPFHNQSVDLEFEKSKAKGQEKPSWLRIYAIRIDVNFFVISGGAIKLTKTTNEREHLLLEMEKLDITKKYLQEEDDNFESFEW